MGIFTRWFGAAAQPDFKFSPESLQYVFDASRLADAGAKNGAPATPRDNFEALKILAQFAAQEGVHITAVLTGRPLREAAEGGNYKNVAVHYAENTAACRKTIMQLLQDHGPAQAVVITADAELERMAAAQGAACMRINTFKKALDSRETREGRDNRRGARPPRRNGGNTGGNTDTNPGVQKEKETPSAGGSNGSAPASPSNPDAPKQEILDLIDPI